MKKSILFALAILCSAMSIAQVSDDWRIHPDDAKYKIYGHFETTFSSSGNVSYELTDVQPVGLSFPVKQKFYGGTTTLGNVFFTFDHVTYNGSPDFNNIALWAYDETLNKWIPDVETGKEEDDASNTNEMTVMLVIDCSTSLMRRDKNGNMYDGLADVKNSAKSFIDVMAASSSRGNIHIGIIGFSSIQQTRKLDLQPLTSSSAYRMKNFIDSFSSGNGTALYRSFDDAIDATQTYVRGLSNYAGSAIVTFTDGSDNGSTNSTKKIGSNKAYFKYIKDNVLNKSIGGISYQSYTIFVPGGADVQDPAVERKIVDELKTLAKRDDRFFRVDNTAGLNNQFRYIAQSLIDSWKVLSCFISAGQNGRVCWTFGKKAYKAPAPTPAPVPVSRNGRNIFVGLNGTFGVPFAIGEKEFGMGLNLKVGLDFAYPLSDYFAIGAYMNIGSGYSGIFNKEGGANFDFKVGLLMLAGDVNDRPFIIGIAPCLGYGWAFPDDYLPFELRFGRIIKEHLYITGNLNFGIPLGPCFVLEPGITIGYHFGDWIKTR